MKLELSEFKKQILNNTVNPGVYVCTYEDNTFLVHQYIRHLSQYLGQDPIEIKSLGEANLDNNCFGESDSTLLIYYGEDVSLSEYFAVSGFLFIICKKYKSINSNCTEINFPAITDWQKLELVKQRCVGLSTEDAEWLYNITDGDVYRLNMETRKINSVSAELQSNLLQQMCEENGYIDLNPYKIYDLTNSLFKKDLNKISQIISNLDYIDIEGTGLVTILKNNILDLIAVQMNPGLTPEALGMKPNKFKAIQYNKNKFSNESLINILEFLTSVDMKLKNGELQFTNTQLVHYIVCNFMTLGA